MLIALISDIHANYQALSAVVSHARRTYDPDIVFWCLGDVFGRGPGAAEVWHMLTFQVPPQYWLAGNHDWGLANLIQNFEVADNILAGEFADPAEWQAILRQREILRALGLYALIQTKIEDMPVMAMPFEGVYLAHGSFGLRNAISTPWECVNEYLYNCRQIRQTLDKLRIFIADPIPEPHFITATGQWHLPTLMIVGHTHQRGLFWLGEECHSDHIEVERWYDLPNTPEQPVLINPGSVGFPRDFWDEYCASYAVLDWNAKSKSRVCFHRVPYDRPTVLRWIDERAYPPKIKDKLSGRCHFAYTLNCPCKELKE